MALTGAERRDLREIAAGFMFMAIGAAFLTGALTYNLGSALHMGAGFYPTLLAVLLVILGMAAVIRGALTRVAADKIELDWRGGVFVLGAILLFAATIKGGGLYVAMPVAVVFASLAARPLRPLLAFSVAIGMTIGSDLIFRHGLNMPLPALGFWF